MVPSTTTLVCGDTTSTSTGDTTCDYLEIASEVNQTVAADGSITGNYTRTVTGAVTGTRTMTWHLTPQRQ
jgi:hypothetical protein